MLPMLDSLDDRALDELPFGVVCIGESGRVERMNRVESEASGIQRWRAIGRGFFTDVAPGPTNAKLAEHVRAFARDRALKRRIPHTFQRRAGADPTTIELHRGSTGRVYLCILREETASAKSA